MKQLILTIIVLLIFGIFVHGKKVGNLTGINIKMPILRLDDKQIYIGDQGLKKVFILKRDTLEKINEFGRYGEGPGEFLGINQFSIDDKYLYISSFPKLCIFSKDGKLIKEIRGPSKTGNYKPFGDNFIGTFLLPSGPADDYIKNKFELFDNTLHKKKDLFLTEFHSYTKFYKGKDYVYWFRDCVESFVYKDNLFIGTTEKGFYFAVFDINGKKLYDINRVEEKRKITDIEKDAIFKGIRDEMGEQKWNEYKGRYEIIFGDYYPAYQSFFVNDDKIYVFTFPKINGHFNIYILDLKGNIIKVKIASVMDLLVEVNSKNNYVIDGKLYYIYYNYKSDEVELRYFDIYP